MRPVATREAVFDAANALRDAGEEPSSRAVRDAVGGGSLATIQRHLRAWRADGGTPSTTVPDDADGVADRLDALTTALVGLRLDLAEKDDQAVLAALAGLRDDLSAQAAPGFEIARAIAGLRADLAETGGGDAGPEVAAAIAEMRRDLRALTAAISPLMEEIRRLSAERDRLQAALAAARSETRQA